MSGRSTCQTTRTPACCARAPGALEILEVEHHHVAAIPAAALQVASGRGVRRRRRDDLDKAVSQREDRVDQTKLRDSRIAIGLPEPQLGCQREHGRLEVARHEHRLAQPHTR